MTKLRFVAQKDTVDWISTYSSAKSPEDPPTKTSPVVGHNLWPWCNSHPKNVAKTAIYVLTCLNAYVACLILYISI